MTTMATFSIQCIAFWINDFSRAQEKNNGFNDYKDYKDYNDYNDYNNHNNYND